MALINLKFSPEMEELVLQGKKCCTTRDEKKGDTGDVFRVKDRIYRIVGIYSNRYEYIDPFYKLDGFETSDEYLDALAEFYPDLYPEMHVYVHFFAYFDRACDDFGYSGQCIAKETCKVGEWCSKKKMVYL